MYFPYYNNNNYISTNITLFLLYFLFISHNFFVMYDEYKYFGGYLVLKYENIV